MCVENGGRRACGEMPGSARDADACVLRDAGAGWEGVAAWIESRIRDGITAPTFVTAVRSAKA